MTATSTTATRLAAFALLGLLAACSGDSGSATATGSGASSGTAGGAGSGISSTALGAGGAGANGAVPGSEEDLAKNVGDRVYFAFDKAQLTPDDQTVLDRQAAWLAQYPTVRVMVAGNCDERGTEEYNLALGQRRANVARDYLVAKGVPRTRIQTISYGKERPQPDALCSAESCLAKNRNAITSVEK
ncbi:MAG: peptidoglycan-associated lipoprotein Pal [Rhodospirillales bacterium]|nr:peptidoglycan-associated lipoprotein Pal [Rhodospirillales bacterium]